MGRAYRRFVHAPRVSPTSGRRRRRRYKCPAPKGTRPTPLPIFHRAEGTASPKGRSAATRKPRSRSCLSDRRLSSGEPGAFGFDAECSAVVASRGIRQDVVVGVSHGGEFRRRSRASAGALCIQERVDPARQVLVDWKAKCREHARRGSPRIFDEGRICHVRNALGSRVTESRERGELGSDP